MWREFGTNHTVGIESFKTRCHFDGEKWVQNTLILDIGGGTTDIALIELALREEKVFEPDEERGLGGRYYVLTPKVLGSTGHLQLGGEFITLRIFNILKALIADKILTAVQEGKISNDRLFDAKQGLSDRFAPNNEYQSGSILKGVNSKSLELDNEALRAANLILPTDFKDIPERARLFYLLWDYAENAKLTLGNKKEFGVNENQIVELLAVCDIVIEDTLT